MHCQHKSREVSVSEGTTLRVGHREHIRASQGSDRSNEKQYKHSKVDPQALLGKEEVGEANNEGSRHFLKELSKWLCERLHHYSLVLKSLNRQLL